ncbi:ComF family protein [Bacillus mangrovi]|uniref:ComF family protein n=1 Tax=Metabacillus mangrovi TaxID=1491830 RepID=A0A7X2S7G7_9BACI|nr:ComF family protein [Metabacillus mangrovi]MTH55053.1 ComF family protein [Metabacillus mangrovi]
MSWCILCHGYMQEQVSWGILFGTDPVPAACEPCLEKLTKISGPRCSRCSRPMEEERVCGDCERWGAGVLDRNLSVYSYTDSVKEIMNLYKFRGDAELVRLFETDIRTVAKQLPKKAMLVPIPLSIERLQERGFNQAELLAKAIRRPILLPLERITSEKQSKKSRRERLAGGPLFKLSSDHLLQGAVLVIVDDIYTTGNTVYQAARLLKDAGAASVSSLTLIRG